MIEDDPLALAYKRKFPGLSDEGAQIQALLNRFAAKNPVGWKQTTIAPDAIFLEADKEDSNHD